MGAYGKRDAVIKGAKRHWKKQHVDHGEEDSAEAALELGPTVVDDDGKVVDWYNAPLKLKG